MMATQMLSVRKLTSRACWLRLLTGMEDPVKGMGDLHYMSALEMKQSPSLGKYIYIYIYIRREEGGQKIVFGYAEKQLELVTQPVVVRLLDMPGELAQCFLYTARAFCCGSP